MTTESNALDVIAYWKGACETANGMVLALMDDCATLRTEKNELTAERDQLRTALRETREVLRDNSDPKCVCTSCSNATAVLARHAGLVEEVDRG